MTLRKTFPAEYFSQKSCPWTVLTDEQRNISTHCDAVERRICRSEARRLGASDWGYAVPNTRPRNAFMPKQPETQLCLKERSNPSKGHPSKGFRSRYFRSCRDSMGYVDTSVGQLAAIVQQAAIVSKHSPRITAVAYRNANSFGAATCAFHLTG